MDKETIRARLWPGVHVVEASLNNLATEIRAELGPAASEGLLRTVHRVGYAFEGEAPVVRAVPVPPHSAPYWLLLKERVFALEPGDNVIGRDASCEVWVDSTSVSRRHAVLRVPGADGGGTATVEDLGSTNGTYLSGRRTTGVAELEDGARIRLGQVTVVFRAQPGGGAPTKRVRRPKGAGG